MLTVTRKSQQPIFGSDDWYFQVRKQQSALLESVANWFVGQVTYLSVIQDILRLTFVSVG